MPFLVVFFGESKVPLSAYKVARGEWKDLGIKVAESLPSDLRDLNLYPGHPTSGPPDLVTEW